MDSQFVAVVGASPRNFWTTCAIHNLTTLNPALRVVPVTPNHSEIDGLATVPDVSALPGTPRAAIIAIRREAAVEAVRTLTLAGTRDIVVVTDGFVERGDAEGAVLQQELADIVQGTETRLWGPNCVGFADFSERICAVAEPVWLDADPGPVSIVSQSGALLSAFVASATQEGLGVDFCVSTGNGAVNAVPEALRIAVERDTTRVVCAYVEGIQPAQVKQLTDVFETARRLGKQIIVLKSGVSERGRKAVLSHTASIAGTDAVFSELLRTHGVLRADGVDEMMRLATLSLLGVKKGRDRAVSVLGGSGGAAALSSDLADRYGVRLTSFADSTIARIKALAGPGSLIDNPLDVIGVKRREGDESVNACVFSDPNTGLVLMPWSVQFPAETAHESIHTWNWGDLARLSAAHEMPLIITSMAPVPDTGFTRRYRREHPHVAVLDNLHLTFAALAKLFPAQSGERAGGAAHEETGVLSEADSREILAAAGVPVVGGVRVTRDTLSAADGLRPPFAVKVIAPVSHKMKIGGVLLGVPSHAALADAVDRIEKNVAESGVAADRIEGCLVEEMVFGRELLVGLNTDPVLGRYIVVGLGGSATEIANRSTTRLLPLHQDDAEALLAAAGVTGHLAAAAAISSLCEAFASAGFSQYQTIEVNPLIVGADACWAADAVVTLAPETGRDAR
ncbi:acetate--CoA ligase family protein [Amycolatopsis benzoatilytica]|uniref:acetate--CoA ligase family protein n=1 Tax=Amycolatopsis benzoatilytica TaxID=346045 RepID=UPI0003680011|nr:acetate--CoA ligase family protein [Amycolatopsis benzoatilytica]